MTTKNLPSFHRLKGLLGYPPDRIATRRPTCVVTAIRGLWAPQHLTYLLLQQSFVREVKVLPGRKLQVTLVD